MVDRSQESMAEALRLTGEGRLQEATAVIQRALGGTPAPASFGRGARGAEPSTTARQQHEAMKALRRAPGPPRSFRSAPRAAPERPATGAQGRFVERTYSNQAGTRSYKLYIPSGYTGQQAVPLVVMLHGCTQGPDDLAAGTGMNALADTHAFIVAYPAQSTGANSSRCWNWFQAAHQQRGRGEPSIVAGITCEVVGEYHVDARRVYAAGMSAGGAMAAVMGAAYPDLYAAIGVHSGLAPGAAQDLSSALAAMKRGGSPTGGPARTAPVIVFHGDRDTTVHPCNADLLFSYYTCGPEKLSAQVSVHEGRVPGGYAYTRMVHHHAGGRPIKEQWTVHGLAHAWSGGSRAGSYTDPKGPDASAEMIRFFNEHRQAPDVTTG